jgi:phosphomannomutase
MHYTPTSAELEEALKSMILSASGWRKVFAPDEESRSPDLRPVDRALSLGMADAFVSFLFDQTARKPLRVCVGCDARFTGPALADGMIRVLLARGVIVDDLGVVAAPEIMAWVQTGGVHDGFIYISASHNPIGHNGVKFGLSDGGVVGGKLAADLIARFRASVTAENAASWIQLAETVSTTAMETVRGGRAKAKQFAEAAYAALGDEILTLSVEPVVQAERKAELTAAVKAKALGIVGELNGSARGISIDRPWLEQLGVRVIALNTQPGQFVHRIVPEGSSLDLCRRELEKAAVAHPGFVFGYVPDCDGDRGNVVWFDERSGAAHILEAQEVFALGVLAELAGLEYYGHTGKVAVVCNDPTSFRVDVIAKAFGASVFRAEVGEANVVGLARKLRSEGWTVRIVGEGSNGGNITHPGCVRDPLSTLGSLIKLLCLDSPERPGPFALWCRHSGQTFRPGFTMADVIATLPAWTTTPASEDRAMLKISSTDHARLKTRFEERWPAQWNAKKEELSSRFGVESWEEFNYEGIEERAGVGSTFRTGRQTGGLKIVLRDREGQSSAMLWMRGSGTEPVFRVMTEVRGADAEGEGWLLQWLTEMVKAADAG